jgi:hypothetical protein
MVSIFAEWYVAESSFAYTIITTFDASCAIAPPALATGRSR